jgi:type II secretory pathway pseudopilin PulG
MNRSVHPSLRRGFALVALLVVIAIIGTLIGLPLPAVQTAREAARKSQCSHNVRQMALGALNYESANARYPTAGQGYDFTLGLNQMNLESMFTQILPFIDQAGIACKWQPRRPYWSTAAGSDGTSNTAIFLEDSGRSLLTKGRRTLDVAAGNAMWVSTTGGSGYKRVTTYLSGDAAEVGSIGVDGSNSVPNRWADSDNAGGGKDGQKALPNCDWQLNNCGSNDEPFSMHSGGGCFAGFGDGSVHWLNEKFDVQVLRQLSDPADGDRPLSYE